MKKLTLLSFLFILNLSVSYGSNKSGCSEVNINEQKIKGCIVFPVPLYDKLYGTDFANTVKTIGSSNALLNMKNGFDSSFNSKTNFSIANGQTWIEANNYSAADALCNIQAFVWSNNNNLGMGANQSSIFGISDDKTITQPNYFKAYMVTTPNPSNYYGANNISYSPPAFTLNAVNKTTMPYVVIPNGGIKSNITVSSILKFNNFYNMIHTLETTPNKYPTNFIGIANTTNGFIIKGSKSFFYSPKNSTSDNCSGFTFFNSTTYQYKSFSDYSGSDYTHKCNKPEGPSSNKYPPIILCVEPQKYTPSN